MSKATAININTTTTITTDLLALAIEIEERGSGHLNGGHDQFAVTRLDIGNGLMEATLTRTFHDGATKVPVAAARLITSELVAEDITALLETVGCEHTSH